MNKIILIGTLLVVVVSLSPLITADSNLAPPNNIRVTNIPQLNNEEQVFICPTDTTIIIANWRDFRLGYRQIGIGRSIDAGQTWTDSLISPDMQYYFADAWQSDPTLTVDRSGNFIMSVLDFLPGNNTGNSVISFYRSTDKGLSWTGPVPAHQPGSWFEDKQFITVDRTGGLFDGRLYCAWCRFPNPDRIMLVSSGDGGLTFSDTITVGPVQHSSGCGSSPVDAGQFAIPIVSANGNVHVFWMGTNLDSTGGCTANTTIKQRVSTDGGLTFGTPEQNILPVTGYMYASGGINIYSMPVGDADITNGPFRGNLYLAFTNVGAEDSLGHPDVDFIRSTDNGQTWSSRFAINDDSNSIAIDNFHPWMITNEEGVIICVFYDQRFDAPSYYRFDLNAAYSFDGGQTFTTNHRISSVSSSPANLKPIIEPAPGNNVVLPAGISSVAQPMAGVIGEYIGVTAFHDKINAVWTDTRDGNQEVYTANWALPLLEPRLQTPPSGSYQHPRPHLAWATSWKQNQDRYRVELSNSPTFASLANASVVDTNFLVTDSLPDGVYYWRVKGFKIPTGDSSGYSKVWSFEVDNTAPAAPTLLSPADNTTVPDSQPTFGWSASALPQIALGSPVSYDLFVSTDSTFPGTLATRSYLNLATTTYRPADKLTPSTLYFWRVRAKDALGNASLSVTFDVTYSPSCCVGKRGNINCFGVIDLADLSALVSYLTGGGFVTCCFDAMNVNGIGIVDLADLSYLVCYLTGGGCILPNCP